MKTEKLSVIWAVLLATAMLSAGCSGGGGGGAAADSTPSNTSPSSNGSSTGKGNGDGTVRLSGQVAVGAAALRSAGLRSGSAVPAKYAVHFATAADSALPDAEVTLYKVSADGTKSLVSGVTATTDASGNYILENVPNAVTGTGAATDFYYEVHAASGSLEVSAPVAPTTDSVVNVSPETKIAAAMISDAAGVPGSSEAAVLPTGKAIDLLRDAVFANIGKMSTFTLPSMLAGNEGQVTIAASAVSANSGNSEKLMRAYDSLKEGLYLRNNRGAVSDARVASYLERVLKSACDFQNNGKVPQAASAALAKTFKDGTVLTLGQIVDAFNHNGGFPQATESGAIDAYYETLTALNTALSGGADIPAGAMLGIYVSNGALSTMSTGSTFEVDQALALLQAMTQSQQRCQVPFSYRGIAADLTGDTTLTTTPAFNDVEVYHQRMQCFNGGSLAAQVEVFVPQGSDISGVTIFAPGMKDQFNNDISSALSLTTDDFYPQNPGPGPAPVRNHWRLSGGSTQACLAFGQTYTFTIAAGLSSGGSLTTEVTRAVVDVPEAHIALMAKDYSESGVVFTQANTGQPDNPIKLSSTLSSERPLFKWDPTPGDAQTIVPGAPAGSKIKYLFDVSHFAVDPQGGGGPENRDFTACPVMQNNNKFFEENYILSPIDCDVDACDAALPDRQHVCRIHVQTVLVDEFDRTLGWSAGADLYYCIEGQSNCP